MQPHLKLTLLSALLLSQTPLQAAEYREVENPPATANAVIKDSFVVTYEADDFTDEVEDAKVLYIPEHFGTQAAFFLRCRPYYTNFSVQYLEKQANLKNSDGSLTNEAASFAKHGYVYNADHDIDMRAGDQYDDFEVLVGGQNKHLTQLFKTDLPHTPGLLGMSFHFTFNYTEMPEFRSATNTGEAKSAYRLLRHAIEEKTPLTIELDGRNAPDRYFELDAQRMTQTVPPEVLDFCLSGRTLLE